ncbi:MAG: hypothetical protein HKN70_14860 [Gammaproteobacteria bacterium]|nr:hypothetical protein [Gammaproteobacteria bacterium]
MNENAEFEKSVKQLLRAQRLDDAVRHKLDDARRKAIAATRPHRQWQQFAAAASLALVALVATFLMIPETAPPLSEGVEDIELLLAEENFELFEELEFYQWLSAQSDAG